MTLPLWVWAAVMGAIAQTGRNATQAGLTTALGTVGATQVRFLFGLPFAVLFLLAHALWSGDPIPLPGPATLGWTALGAWAQGFLYGFGAAGPFKPSAGASNTSLSILGRRLASQ